MTQRAEDRTSGFGSLLRRRRQEAGLTQEALAEQAGISANAVAALERGRRTRPRPDTVTLLAEALTLEAGSRAEFIAASMSEDSVRAQEGKPSAVGLPGAGRPLFGRDVDVAAVVGLLRQHRLVTLTGPGGIGKTRLAMAVIAATNEGGRDAAFVDLAPVHDPGLFPTVTADSLGLAEESGVDGIDGLKAHLRDRELLLTLDNFERIVAAAPYVSEMLDDCPNLRILVTSRIPLRLSVEHRFSVPPLPTGDGTPTGEDPSTFPAVRLFIARAQQIHPGSLPTSPGFARLPRSAEPWMACRSR